MAFTEKGHSIERVKGFFRGRVAAELEKREAFARRRAHGHQHRGDARHLSKGEWRV
jgi:hypothetical protein